MKKLMIALSAMLFVTSCNNVTELPQVTTSNPAVSDTAVMAGGDVTFTGGDNKTARGVCWSTIPNPTTSDNFMLDASTGGGVYSIDILSQLNPNSQYYFKAYAENSVGKSYGEEYTITTGDFFPLPQVTTTSATVTLTKARVGGDVTFTGGYEDTERGGCWSTSPNPTTSDNFMLDASTGTGSYNFDILAQLQPNTKYYFKAYAENKFGKVYGNELEFTTLDPNPKNAFINSNGCVECDNYSAGETFVLNQEVWIVADNTIISDNYIVDFTQYCVSKVTNMSYLFTKLYHPNFNQDISHWDVSNVTNMGYMFNEMVNFNKDIGNWDVSNVTSMDGMFKGATAFNKDISNWDVSSVTLMVSMFQEASSFNQDIGNWDVSSIVQSQSAGNWFTGFRRMFKDASSFNQDLSDWCVSNISSTIPYEFSNNSSWLWIHLPQWGNCP